MNQYFLTYMEYEHQGYTEDRVFENEVSLLDFLEGKDFYYMSVIYGKIVNLEPVQKVTKWEVVK